MSYRHLETATGEPTGEPVAVAAAGSSRFDRPQRRITILQLIQLKYVFKIVSCL